MRVTDPRHPLFGQRLTVLDLSCSRGPRFIAVALLDGRRRLIRRAATELEHPATTDLPVPLVSARTLLPLARHVRGMLAASSTEPADVVPSPRVYLSTAIAPASTVETVAGTVGPIATAAGSGDGALAAAPMRGGTPC